MNTRLVSAIGAALFAAWLTSCGGGETEQQPPQPPVAQTAAESAPPPPAPSARMLQRAAQAPGETSTGFRHGPHRTLACSNCHQNPPGHREHAGIACTKCHQVPETFEAMRQLNVADCRQCHHVQRRDLSCEHCHDRSTLAGAHERVTTVRMSVWSVAKNRTLSFEHAWHRDVECKACHTEAPGYAPQTACSTCHDKHHTADATCTRCHTLPPQDRLVHAEEAHAGCGGTGCHQDPRVAALPPRRALCLVCHAAMSDHESGQECVRCHAVAPAWQNRGSGGDVP